MEVQERVKVGISAPAGLTKPKQDITCCPLPLRKARQRLGGAQRHPAAKVVSEPPASVSFGLKGLD